MTLAGHILVERKREATVAFLAEALLSLSRKCHCKYKVRKEQ